MLKGVKAGYTLPQAAAQAAARKLQRNMLHGFLYVRTRNVCSYTRSRQVKLLGIPLRYRKYRKSWNMFNSVRPAAKYEPAFRRKSRDRFKGYIHTPTWVWFKVG